MVILLAAWPLLAAPCAAAALAVRFLLAGAARQRRQHREVLAVREASLDSRQRDLELRASYLSWWEHIYTERSTWQ